MYFLRLLRWRNKTVYARVLSPHFFALYFTMEIYCQKDNASSLKIREGLMEEVNVEMGLETLVDCVYIRLKIKTYKTEWLTRHRVTLS